jgi:aryl-alcohol dehydrogenase-like predicted oxidoreductase
VIDQAFDSGVTFFDCGDNYGGGRAEGILGEVLKHRRQQVIITTKFGRPMFGLENEIARGSRHYIYRAVEGSLTRLKTDYIDLYYYHWPDPHTPVEETLRTLDDLVRDGKVRYIGCSNVAAWQIADWVWTARMHNYVRFISVQNPGNLLNRPLGVEVTDACQHYGLGMVPAYPLANGLLTGKYRFGEPPPPETRLANAGVPTDQATFERLQQLTDFAGQCGRSLLDIAIGGLAAQPGVTSVIAGATRAEQVKANVAAGEWQPSREELEGLATLMADFR